MQNLGVELSRLVASRSELDERIMDKVWLGRGCQQGIPMAHGMVLRGMNTVCSGLWHGARCMRAWGALHTGMHTCRCRMFSCVHPFVAYSHVCTSAQRVFPSRPIPLQVL